MPQPLESRYLTDQWVDSKTAGGVSEVTLFTPIKPGFIPGEARTYEERLWSVLASVQRRAVANTPTPIGLMPTIHYARWMVLRPGQYLQYSGYPLHPVDAIDQRQPQANESRLETNGGLPYGHRSWLYFTSNFDGDMKTYLRDFSVNLGEDVDRIWGNCEGYPVGGAADFDAYWEYAKRHQIKTHAFYNAYPHLNVLRSTHSRDSNSLSTRLLPRPVAPKVARHPVSKKRSMIFWLRINPIASISRPRGRLR